MSDRICIMRDGQIEQVGSPRELYDRPANRYVAGFVGSTNFFDAEVTALEGAIAHLKLASGQVVEAMAEETTVSGEQMTLSVRPEQIHLSRSKKPGPILSVTVLNRIFLGEHTEYLVQHETLGEILVLSPRQSELSEGSFNVDEKLYASWDAVGALILPKD